MKPTVISNANTSTSTGGDGSGGISTASQASSSAASNGINIPINHGYHPQQPHSHQQQPHSHQQQHYPGVDASTSAGTGYGSPGSFARQQHQQPPYAPHSHAQQQNPPHFQTFGFEPDMDMDMDMFPRSRLGRMHDPFGSFGGTRKRSSLHEPHSMATDDFSRYFDDAADFGFPQFSSMGRRQRDDDDFFTRLPSEFRQYIPDTFGHRRAGTGSMPTQQQPMPSQGGPYYQTYVPSGTTPPSSASAPPQSPSKKLCDAAIQTEERSEVDGNAASQPDNLNQHGLRNTVDMGVKSAVENEGPGPRSHSAPPNEQLQQQQQAPANGQQRPTPPPQAGRPQFGGPPTPSQQYQQPQFQKAYYAPQQQAHSQQKQQTPPPPQTPGGTYIRTIPIFVEGRSEPIINAHKEIPNQNAAAGAGYGAGKGAQASPQQQQQQPYYPQGNVHHQQSSHPSQQSHRPTPLNTQQAQQPPQQYEQGAYTGAGAGVPPQTPHTVDSINKIQDIQRDVLDLMSKVERFTGTRKDKEYAYLDEMLTRNLLKLDTIDTNGKDSIRLARKEAIKCIQASINVLEAKAEENAKTAAAAQNGSVVKSQSGGSQTPSTGIDADARAGVSGENSAIADASQPNAETKDTNEKSSTATEQATTTAVASSQTGDSNSKELEAIPLPPPDGVNIDASNAAQQEAATNIGTDTAEATTSSSSSAAAAADADKEAIAGATISETK